MITYSDAWGFPPSNYKKFPTFHYFIRDASETLCGHRKISHITKRDIVFITPQKIHKICISCKSQVEYYKTYGKKLTESKIYNVKIKSSSQLAWGESRCDHVDKKGKRCTFKGRYPTGDLEKSKLNDHFCPEHNLRLKVSRSHSRTSTLEVTS